MKKIILNVMLTMSAITISNAQDIDFGIKAGAQLANLIGDDIEGQKAKLAAYGGVYANFGITEVINIQPELLFSMQGAKNEDDNDETLNYNYLNIPVMVQYQITNEFYGEFGPQLGILLKAEVEDNNETDNIKEFTEIINFGLNAGFGYTMDNGLGINARYGLGLTRFVNVNKMKLDVKHSVISFGLSYNI